MDRGWRRWPARRTTGQKAVLSLGFGALLVVLRQWLLAAGRADGGWFMYAPNDADVVVSSGGLFTFHPGRLALLEVGLVLAWVLGSCWLFQPVRTGSAGGGDGHDEPDGGTA